MRQEKNKLVKSIATLLWVVMLFSCKTSPVKMEELSKELVEPVVSSEHIEWFYTKNGEASFKLNSPQMFRFEGEEPYLEFPSGISLQSFQEKGEKDSYLKADYAIKYLEDKIIEAKGSVLLQNIEGDKLETEFLIWDEANELIYTEEFVKITKGQQVIMGEGFQSDIYITEYTLKKSKGILNIQDAE
jgi:LPS export ABC transporter protein LptC